MATKPNRKNRKSSFAEAKSGGAPPEKKPSPVRPTKEKPRWFLIGLFVTIVFGGGALAMVFKDIRSWGSAMGTAEQFTYKLVKKYPHDPMAFTQGFFFHQGKLYESTGLYGESTMRIIDLETGDATPPNPKIFLGESKFGEGATQHNGKIYQLTWKEGECLVYDLDLNLLETIKYEGEGWGLCSDGENLIMTDGTAKLIYVDPKDFSVIKKVYVKLGNRSVSQLNELEYYNGNVFANQLDRDFIYEINAKTGKVISMVDLTGLWPFKERPEKAVWNGIAFDESKSIFVTGKYCPHIYEITFELKK